MHFKMYGWRFGCFLNVVARCNSNNNNEQWPLGKSLTVDYVHIFVFEEIKCWIFIQMTIQVEYDDGGMFEL